MKLRARQVHGWLALIRAKEPTIRWSVEAWLERDRERHVVAAKRSTFFARPEAIAIVPGPRSGRRRSILIDQDCYLDLCRESARQDRSMSWLVQQAWRLARPAIKSLVTP